jgi:hypothetical protein
MTKSNPSINKHISATFCMLWSSLMNGILDK